MRLMALLIAFCTLILSIFSLVDLGLDYLKLQERITSYGERINGLSEQYPNASELLLPLLPFLTHFALFVASVFIFGIIASLLYLTRRNIYSAYTLGLSCISYGVLSIALTIFLSRIQSALVLDGLDSNIPEGQIFMIVIAVLFFVAGGILFATQKGSVRGA